MSGSRHNAVAVTEPAPTQRRVLVVGKRAAACAYANAAPADPVLNLHAQLRALHGTAWHVRVVALAAFGAARRTAETLREPCTVWLIHPDPTPAQLRGYLDAGYELLDADTAGDS